jgi:hypothetical protein
MKDATLNSSTVDGVNVVAMQAQLPRLERLLNLHRILSGPPAQSKALVRSGQSTAGLHGREQSVTVRSVGDRQQPDGSERLNEVADTAELCEDEYGITECATDEEIEEAQGLASSLQSEVEAMEVEVETIEANIAAYCSSFPQDCIEPLPPTTQSPTVQMESDAETNGGVETGPSVVSREACDPEGMWACIGMAAGSVLGIPTTFGEVGALWTIAHAATKPSRLKLAAAVASALGCTTALALLIAATAIYCYYYADEPKLARVGPLRLTPAVDGPMVRHEAILI